MAKKRRTSRKPGRKEALAVIILAMLVGLARQMLAPSYDLSNIPDYDGTSAYAVIDRNQPSFTEEEYTTDSYEYYSELDSLGRCGTAYANICRALMHRRRPHADRGAGEHQQGEAHRLGAAPI